MDRDTRETCLNFKYMAVGNCCKKRRKRHSKKPGLNYELGKTVSILNDVQALGRWEKIVLRTEK